MQFSGNMVQSPQPALYWCILYGKVGPTVCGLHRYRLASVLFNAILRSCLFLNKTLYHVSCFLFVCFVVYLYYNLPTGETRTTSSMS